jgi:hypothetical protein
VTRELLDAREMEHPEPLERAIAILRELDGERYLYMLHRKEPTPLLALAKEHRLNHLSHCDAEGVWHILITPDSSVDLEDLLEPGLGRAAP